VIELAAGAAQEALLRRWSIGAVRRKVAGEPAAENAIAKRHRQRGHQSKRTRPAGLIETEATTLGGLDSFADGRDRQPGQSRMAERFADGQAGARLDRAVEVRPQLGPARAGEVGDRF